MTVFGNKIDGELVHGGVTVKFKEYHTYIICTFLYGKKSIEIIMFHEKFINMNAKDLIEFIDGYVSILKGGV